MANPHDRLFREVFSEPEQIGSMVRTALPAEVAAGIDWSALGRVPGSFIDDEFREHHADLLFTTTVDGEETLLYVLCEHKSQAEIDTVCQLLRYLTRLWEAWQRDRPGAPLPPVLLYVLHHGTRPWSAPTRLHQRIAFDRLPVETAAFLRGLLPDLGFVLDDLAAQSQEELRDRAANALASLTALLLSLSRGRSDEEIATALARWRDILNLVFDRHGQDRLLLLLSYLIDTTEIEPMRVRVALGDRLGQRMEEPLMTTAERLRQEGMTRGLVEGRHEGRVEILLDQIVQRFGSVPAEVEVRIRGANDTDIQRMARAVLTATTLAQVLDG